MNDAFMHYGVKGMRWGIRRTKSGAKGNAQAESKSKLPEATPRKKKISEMTDAELKEKIERLGLEKRYKEAMATTLPPPKTKSRAQKLVEDILYDSAKNIGTQTMVYVMGKASNKLLKKMFDDANAVNPYQGQKGRRDQKEQKDQDDD